MDTGEGSFDTYYEGKRQAEIAIAKEKFKRLYALRPLKWMTKLDEEIADLQYEKELNICMITINFPWGFNLNLGVLQDVENVLKSKVWIKKVYQITRENMGQDDDKKYLYECHPHIHACCLLADQTYTPSNIADMIWKTKYIKQICDIEKKFINVNKCRQAEKVVKIRYCQKEFWREDISVFDFVNKYNKKFNEKREMRETPTG